MVHCEQLLPEVARLRVRLTEAIRELRPMWAPAQIHAAARAVLMDAIIKTWYPAAFDHVLALHGDTALSHAGSAPIHDLVEEPRIQAIESVSCERWRSRELATLPENALGAVHEMLLAHSPAGEAATTASQGRCSPSDSLRKRQGSYYTPTWLVGAVLERALRPRVKHVVDDAIAILRSGDPRRARQTAESVLRVRVVDPACGGGSFLLGAHSLICEEIERYNSAVRQSAVDATGPCNESWLADVPDVARRVAASCLYGVDLDPYAIRLSQILILAKAVPNLLPPTDVRRNGPLEENGAADANRWVSAGIVAHLRWGDSVLEGAAEGADGASARERSPRSDAGASHAAGQSTLAGIPDCGHRSEADVGCRFCWEEAFPEVQGAEVPEERRGFDVVVGNPPYFKLDAVFGHSSPATRYLKEHFPEVHTDKTDILFYFVAKAVLLLAEGGDIGFVVSRAFVEADKARKLRRLLTARTTIISLLDFNGHDWFGAGIATLLLHLRKTVPAPTHMVRVDHVVDATAARCSSASETGVLPGATLRIEVPQRDLGGDAWPLTPFAALFDAIDRAGPRLRSWPQFERAQQGIQTGENAVFVGPLEGRLPSAYLRRCVKGSGISAFGALASGEQLLYVTSDQPFEQLHPDVQAYLRRHEPVLRARAAVREGSCAWYALHRARAHGRHSHFRPKILVPYRASESRFVVDETGIFAGLTDTTAIFVKDDSLQSLHVLCALLNSPVLEFRYRSMGGLGKLTGPRMFEYFRSRILDLPVIDFSKLGSSADEAKLADLSREAHELATRSAANSDPAARSRSSHALAALSREERAVRQAIAVLSYRLYGVERARDVMEDALRTTVPKGG